VTNLAFELPDELVDAIATRVLERLGSQAPASDDGWLRGAEAIAGYIGAPPSRVYGLTSAKRIPVHHDGPALVAKRSELDAWILAGGGRRP
jgi:hypothetical protein